MGRLGNQMFQFSSSIGIAKKLGYEIFFPIENCFTEASNGPKDPKTGLNMNVKCDLLDCFNLPVRFFKTAQNINTGSPVYERKFTFDPSIYSISDGTDLAGYFQTEKYFKEFKETILKYFSFRPEVDNGAWTYWYKEIVPFLKDCSSVSVHVRRGDYTLFPNHHPTCTKDYYDRAINSFGPNVKFIVFSDDIEWCKLNFIGENVHIVESRSPYVDLKLMTMCDHNIIANSSFSWWGAWLNSSESKRIIAPSSWFGPSLVNDTSDIYCENWIKI